MADTSLQDVFNRVFAYLRASGVEMTVERYRTLLQLIEEAVAVTGESGQEGELLEAAMARVPRYFELPESIPPKATPPLCRGSIGYGRDV